ncbi:hypothetical protein CDD82_186 [Ophiocordyceps australis]|uniref:Uncharacterized protein n=1 Tax=Ophiocordyceps australis TaxID=1399860 RepID=A0A2C5YHE5_9HYPO|nr:hypothetical protein CDD82_186 [Ophiocordyceps australis]
MSLRPLSPDDDFPCTLALSIPLLTPRLASIALETLQVDTERSPLVRRQLYLGSDSDSDSDITVLHVNYQATTNLMQQLDTDVIDIDLEQLQSCCDQQETPSQQQESRLSCCEEQEPLQS